MAQLQDFTIRRIDGTAFDLAALKGRVVLWVNTASACGFTPQFAGLEDLHRTYGPRGLVVMGFPCNQFGGQDPGSNDEIGAALIRNAKPRRPTSQSVLGRLEPANGRCFASG